MKKIFLIAMLLVSTTTYSQDIIPFTFGPMISMTSTSVSASPDFHDQIAGAGYDVGGFARLKILLLYAQLEASFSSKSTSVVLADSSSVNSNVLFRLNGLDLSLIGGMKLFGLGSLGNFRIFLGYNLNNYSDITYALDGNDLSTDNVNTNNSSILGGIGVDLSRLTIDLKYSEGLTDIASSPIQKVHTNVISATLGFKIL
jgi:hypothetical protein